jgi:GrpB-like predicted nucleotidyltransferase (UPF0157 family)
MLQAAVRIVPYDANWIAEFEREKALLERVLHPWQSGPIEHIGSTSVIGLCAKPIIDIMVGVSSLPASEPAKDVLREHAYQYSAYRTDLMHWFCKPSFAVRTHHVHLVPYESALWHERLEFRDLLREDSALTEEYAALKQELALTFEFDREAYTDAKLPFIMRALEQHRRRTPSRL